MLSGILDYMSKSFYYYIINNGLYKIGFDLVNIFGILYLFRLFGNSLEISIGLLSLIYLLYPIFEPFILRIIEGLGTKKSMILGSLISVTSVVPMFFFDSKQWYFFAIWIVLTVIAKILYYIPYHYYAVTLTEGQQRGKDISYVTAVILFAGLITPIFGGYITQCFGLTGLAFTCMISLVISIIPLLFIKDYKFKFSRNIFELIGESNLIKTLRIMFVNELQAKETFWSIYIFIMVGESFSNYGILISAVMLFSIPIMIILGKYSDHHNKRLLLRSDGILTSLLWFVRLLITNIYEVVIVDILHKVNMNLKNQTAGIITYDLASKDNQEIILDEKIAIREGFGNLFIGINLLTGLVVAYFFGINGTFVFAGFASLLLLFV